MCNIYKGTIEEDVERMWQRLFTFINDSSHIHKIHLIDIIAVFIKN